MNTNLSELVRKYVINTQYEIPVSLLNKTFFFTNYDRIISFKNYSIKIKKNKDFNLNLHVFLKNDLNINDTFCLKEYIDYYKKVTFHNNYLF